MRGAIMMVLLATACSGEGANQMRGDPNVTIPPNQGTAPDWLVICGERVRREYGVDQNGFRFERQDIREDGVRVAEGYADLGDRGRVRFRCTVSAQDVFLRLETLV